MLLMECVMSAGDEHEVFYAGVNTCLWTQQKTEIPQNRCSPLEARLLPSSHQALRQTEIILLGVARMKPNFHAMHL